MPLTLSVAFLAGTDTAPGVYIMPGFSLHDELANFVEAGFTPMESLQTATSNPAKFLGMQTSLGSVESGKIANLVLLAANPLEDIRNTRKINLVMAGGEALRVAPRSMYDPDASGGPRQRTSRS